MMFDYGSEMGAMVCTDASAAIGMAHRQGLGQTRNTEMQRLWMQSEVINGKLQSQKGGTKQNPADFLPEPSVIDVIHRHQIALDNSADSSMAKEAPKGQGVWKGRSMT